jgi:hypothetical protein
MRKSLKFSAGSPPSLAAADGESAPAAADRRRGKRRSRSGTEAAGEADAAADQRRGFAVLRVRDMLAFGTVDATVGLVGSLLLVWPDGTLRATAAADTAARDPTLATYVLSGKVVIQHTAPPHIRITGQLEAPLTLHLGDAAATASLAAVAASLRLRHGTVDLASTPLPDDHDIAKWQGCTQYVAKATTAVVKGKGGDEGGGAGDEGGSERASARGAGAGEVASSVGSPSAGGSAATPTVAQVSFAVRRKEVDALLSAARLLSSSAVGGDEGHSDSEGAERGGGGGGGGAVDPTLSLRRSPLEVMVTSLLSYADEHPVATLYANFPHYLRVLHPGEPTVTTLVEECRAFSTHVLRAMLSWHATALRSADEGQLQAILRASDRALLAHSGTASVLFQAAVREAATAVNACDARCAALLARSRSARHDALAIAPAWRSVDTAPALAHLQQLPLLPDPRTALTCLVSAAHLLETGLAASGVPYGADELLPALVDLIVQSSRHVAAWPARIRLVEEFLDDGDASSYAGCMFAHYTVAIGYLTSDQPLEEARAASSSRSATMVGGRGRTKSRTTTLAVAFEADEEEEEEEEEERDDESHDDDDE